MRRALVALVGGLAAGLPAARAQGLRAAALPESLAAAGRPWHAWESWRARGTREQAPDAAWVVAGARVALEARRYERARSLLVGQPWLSAEAAGLSLLGEAERRLGLVDAAADRFAGARRGATGAQAALLAVREALALEAAGRSDAAAAALSDARRLGLPAIDDWLRLYEARVTRDSTAAARALAEIGGAPAREAAHAWAGALLAAGDTAAAQVAFARAGAVRAAARLALARGDTAAARAAVYGSGRRPPRDIAAELLELAARAPPRTATELVALARLHEAAGDARRAAIVIQRAVDAGDSTPATLLAAGDLLAAAGHLWPAERAYRAAARDSALAPAAAYRRARVLLRLGDAGGVRALRAFAETWPADTAAPIARYLIADGAAERGDWAAAGQAFGDVIARYPADARGSVARFRLAARARRDGMPDSAAALYQSEIAAGGQLTGAARYWLGRLASEAGDTARARATWAALAASDSIGYYGLRARAAAGLPPPTIAPAGVVAAPPSVRAGLARLDTLALAGLDTAVLVEVQVLVDAPPGDVPSLLGWSEGLAARGFGPAAVRLGWLAWVRAPGDPRALRAVFPFAHRGAVLAEAAEFGIDPFLFAGLVRRESVFDAEARSRAGAQGLAQLLPTTAAQVARGLDVSFEPAWLGVPDLNLHLGAAHLVRLLARYASRVDAALAAYNAGTRPVDRWLRRPGADDPDEFIELISYPETRTYVREVLRNRWLYTALYPDAR